MNTEAVVSQIIDIITGQEAKVYTFAQTCGGWEIWLQCELAHRFDANATREVDVWGDGRACDLYFEETKFIVELKCLGWNVIQTSKAKAGSFGSPPSALQGFVDKVVVDQRKIVEFNAGKGVSIAIIPRFMDQVTDSITDLFTTGGYHVMDITPNFRLFWWAN